MTRTWYQIILFKILCNWRLPLQISCDSVYHHNVFLLFLVRENNIKKSLIERKKFQADGKQLWI